MRCMYDKIYIVQKRNLRIREVSVDYNTAIFVKDIGRYVFFDKAQAEERLEQLILERSAK